MDISARGFACGTKRGLLRLDHQQIYVEHLLLSLLDEEDCEVWWRSAPHMVPSAV